MPLNNWNSFQTSTKVVGNSFKVEASSDRFLYRLKMGSMQYYADTVTMPVKVSCQWWRAEWVPDLWHNGNFDDDGVRMCTDFTHNVKKTKGLLTKTVTLAPRFCFTRSDSVTVTIKDFSLFQRWRAELFLHPFYSSNGPSPLAQW